MSVRIGPPRKPSRRVGHSHPGEAAVPHRASLCQALGARRPLQVLICARRDAADTGPAPDAT
jgi:hypothetical protein